MAIARTAKGTAQSKTGSQTLTLASVAIAQGASILVALACQDVAPTTMTWGAVSLNKDVETVKAGTVRASIWSAHNVNSATSTVTANWGTNVTAKAMAVAEITGLDAAPLDQIAGNSANTSAPSSGATPTTVQADELLYGAIGSAAALGETAAAWDNSWNDGQRDGTTGGNTLTNMCVQEGYLVVSSTGAYTASAVQSPNRDRATVIATYKQASAGAPAAAPGTRTLLVGIGG